MWEYYKIDNVSRSRTLFEERKDTMSDTHQQRRVKKLRVSRPHVIHARILSPRQVMRRYMSSGLKDTRMSKWAMEFMAKGWKIICVHRSELNYNVLRTNSFAFSESFSPIANLLNTRHFDYYAIDLSRPDSIYYACRERNDW